MKGEITLPFRNVLSTHYHIQAEDKIWLDDREGYSQDNDYYFTTILANREIIHMEQAALAYFLMESGYRNISLPITNQNGEWFTSLDDHSVMVLRVKELKQEDRLSKGEALANFHEIGASYQYQPREISSYGQWKNLWIQKLTAYESKIEQEAINHPSDYYRTVMDVLPYIIGISENAIQYVQETDQEHRFSGGDQGTIAFSRYRNHLDKPVLWLDQIVYDHPARDLAEAIRSMFLQNEDEAVIASFLNDYQMIRPLSVFSWRLIYARLIFPIHLFDSLDKGFSNRDQADQGIIELLDKQTDYEKKLRNFFQNAGISHETWSIPVLHWL